MILILSSADDLHVQRVTSHLSPDSFFVLDLRDFGSTVFLNLIPGETAGEIVSEEENKRINLRDIKSVWYRRPRYKRGALGEEWKRVFAENEERVVLDGVYRFLNEKVFWLNNPFMNRQADNKPWQLSLASGLGFDVPPTLITNSSESFLRFVSENKRVVYKPVSKGRIDRPDEVPLVFLTKVIQEEDVEILAPRVSVTPCMFQKYIEKKFEIRVTMLGENVYATAQHSQESEETRIDWRRDPTKVPHERFSLPSNIENQCKALLRRLNLTYGAIDLIYTPEGRFVFLEINPNGQWLWIEDLAGYPISHAIANFLQNGDLSYA